MVAILPKPIRKMLAVFRGQVSPVFIFLSVLLGFSFGLIPGWSGMHTFLVIVVLILNIHLGLFLMSAALGKALCFAAAPVLFHIGVWVHSYLSVLLALLARIPIIGITNFDKYSVAGALVVGPLIGAIAGLLLAWSVTNFRRMLLKFEGKSEKFKKWYSKRWVRILDRLLIGKRTKDVRALFTAKVKVFRLAGVILALLVVLVSVITTTLLKNETARSFVAGKMTQANGAEVDLSELRLSVLAGAVSASGIQVTDPEKPQLNQVSIGKIAADLGVYDLLLGKLVMEVVEVSDVQFGQARTKPGRVTEAETQQKPSVFDPCDFTLKNLDINKLDTYFKNAQAVKEWLQKIRKWLPKTGQKESEKTSEQIPEGYLAYLDAHAATPASPRILAKKILLDKVNIPWPVLGSSNISLQNITDAPHAARLPVAIALKSNDTQASLNMKLDFTQHEKGPLVSGNFDGFDLTKMHDSIGSNTGLAFNSGKASGQFSGLLTSDLVDLTVNIAIGDMQAKAQGDKIWGLDSKTASEALAVMKNLRINVRIIGPVAEPRLAFDAGNLRNQLKEALVKAGKEKLAGEVDKQIQKQLGKGLGDKVPGELGEALKKPGDLIKGLGGLLGGDSNKKD